MNAPLIRMTAMRKLYGAVAAIDDVDFELGIGEIHSLLGENGAGKSTLTKMLSGVGERAEQHIAAAHLATTGMHVDAPQLVGIERATPASPPA